MSYSKLYAILDTEVGEFVSVNSRIAWVSEGNAKRAWRADWSYSTEAYDEQTRYIVVPIEAKGLYDYNLH